MHGKLIVLGFKLLSKYYSDECLGGGALVMIGDTITAILLLSPLLDIMTLKYVISSPWLYDNDLHDIQIT